MLHFLCSCSYLLSFIGRTFASNQRLTFLTHPGDCSAESSVAMSDKSVENSRLHSLSSEKFKDGPEWTLGAATRKLDYDVITNCLPVLMPSCRPVDCSLLCSCPTQKGNKRCYNLSVRLFDAPISRTPIGSPNAP